MDNTKATLLYAAHRSGKSDKIECLRPHRRFRPTPSGAAQRTQNNESRIHAKLCSSARGQTYAIRQNENGRTKMHGGLMRPQDILIHQPQRLPATLSPSQRFPLRITPRISFRLNCCPTDFSTTCQYSHSNYNKTHPKLTLGSFLLVSFPLC